MASHGVAIGIPSHYGANSENRSLNVESEKLNTLNRLNRLNRLKLIRNLNENPIHHPQSAKLSPTQAEPQRKLHLQCGRYKLFAIVYGIQYTVYDTWHIVYMVFWAWICNACGL